MEGGDERLGQRVPAHQLLYAIRHFCRGLISEGDCQDAIGRGSAIVNQMSNAVSDNPGFAATRARQDEKRPFRALHGLALLRIELVQK
jgi:hypothetical protein